MTILRMWVLGVLIVMAVTGCEKVEMPVDEKKDKTEEKNDTSKSDKPGSSDSSEYISYYSVGQAMERLSGVDTTLWIAGYAVGTLSGTSLTSATFSSPFTNTNILLADTPDEDDVYSCMPVELTSKWRSDYALGNNPEIHGRVLLVYGHLTRYFGVTGLKSVSAIELVDTASSESEEKQEVQPSDSVNVPDYPVINDTAKANIIVGRSLRGFIRRR